MNQAKSQKQYRKTGMLMMLMGSILGKFVVVDLLAAARSHELVSVNWAVILFCGAIISSGCLFSLFGEMLVDSFRVNVDTGKPSTKGLVFATTIVVAALFLCLFVQSQLHQFGYAA